MPHPYKIRGISPQNKNIYLLFIKRNGLPSQ